MASTLDFVEYVCEQIRGSGVLRYNKMFGEYMIYVNEKPIVLICDNTAYVKKLAVIEEEMVTAKIGIPYAGAKPHYILDIDDGEFSKKIIQMLEAVTPLPKKKKIIKNRNF